MDYFIVEGVTPTGADQALFAGGPAVTVYRNESAISLQVNRLNPNRSPGALVASLSAANCAGGPLTVPLEAGIRYLVRISGMPGAYTLRNDIDGHPRRLPIQVHDQVYNILHPGEPVEGPLHGVQEFAILPGVRDYIALRSHDPGLALLLFDLDGVLITQAVFDGWGQRLSLEGTNPQEVYLLQIVRTNRNTGARNLSLTWERHVGARQAP